MKDQGEKVVQGEPSGAEGTTTQGLGSITISGSRKPDAAGASWRRPGKQPMEDDRTDDERSPIVVDLAKARGTSRARLVAVGVFLSVISITSKQLISYMKNVWNLRGNVDSLQLADRRFVLEFAQEGDFEHVTRGGPWRYQEDAVLIRKLKEGEVPNLVRFDSMPIWVQFSCIPFYLLSKQLARDLGAKLGECIRIDNEARGDICEKIIRVRVRLPIARALQRWITLEDEFSSEEVVISVLYERLPTFCLSCGVIGHKEENCDLPEMLRKRRYSHALRVPATHVMDPRKWYLPATAGEVGRALQMDLPWRNVAALGARQDPATRVLAIVANVVQEVEKLSVHDKEEAQRGKSDKDGNVKNVNSNEPAPPPTDDNVKNSNNNEPAPPPSERTREPETDITKPKTCTNTGTSVTEATNPAAPVVAPRTWRRVNRDEQAATEKADDTRDVNDENYNNLNMNQGKEKATLIPAEGGSVLGKRQDGAGILLAGSNNSEKRSKKRMGSPKEDAAGDDRKEEATSPGATGSLTGATDGACQSP